MLALALSLQLVVVDGDTLKQGGAYIRIENIDAPESGWRANCDAERMLAIKAADTLAALINGAKVDVIATGVDRYGRTLARVSADGADVGDTLVRAHVAAPWRGRRHEWCAAP
ncbi:MAG: thermonuclease family protein [Pseudomonadota bacterium]